MRPSAPSCVTVSWRHCPGNNSERPVTLKPPPGPTPANTKSFVPGPNVRSTTRQPLAPPESAPANPREPVVSDSGLNQKERLNGRPVAGKTRYWSLLTQARLPPACCAAPLNRSAPGPKRPVPQVVPEVKSTAPLSSSDICPAPSSSCQ